MTFATFFLSSGRCGTQWLAKNLGEVYGDLAVVTHEPIKRNYLPRVLLGIRDPRRFRPVRGYDFRSKIMNHVATIERHLETCRYIECGWPCYGAIRFLAKHFKGRIRVVHLTRHPVPTACSMLTHAYYVKTVHSTQDRGLLTPFEASVSFPEYRERWNDLTRLEKCLYFWAEVNALGLALEQELLIPWLRLKAEDVFDGEGLDRLLDFLELPRRDAIYSARHVLHDKWQQHTGHPLEVAAISRHSKFVEIAITLGYDPLAVDEALLRERYGRPASGQLEQAPRAGATSGSRAPV